MPPLAATSTARWPPRAAEMTGRIKGNSPASDLTPPIVAGSPITRRRFLAGAGVILTGPAILASCGTTRADRGEAQPPNTTRVHFRLVDAQTGKTTPAMACITDPNSSEVRLPPDGRVCAKPSSVQQFVSGIKYSPDRNWIGPVRKYRK